MNKSVKEKTENKLISVMSLVQSHDHEDSPLGKEVKLKWDGFVEKVGLSLE